jgi:hypothetical protein
MNEDLVMKKYPGHSEKTMHFHEVVKQAPELFSSYKITKIVT